MKKKTYVSSAVISAQYGYGFMPVDRSVFSKSPKEKDKLKRLKKECK